MPSPVMDGPRSFLESNVAERRLEDPMPGGLDSRFASASSLFPSVTGEQGNFPQDG